MFSWLVKSEIIEALSGEAVHYECKERNAHGPFAVALKHLMLIQ